MTIGSHLPSAIPRSDEAILCEGCGGVAENLGVVGRINSNQTAWHHRSALATAVAAITRSRRSGTEDGQGGDEGKRDKRSVPDHGDLPFVYRRGCAAS